MNVYTIVVSLSGIIVHDGEVKGSKLKYWGGNIEIYLKGAVPLRLRDGVHYHAMSLARAHHIPLINIKTQGWL